MAKKNVVKEAAPKVTNEVEGMVVDTDGGIIDSGGQSVISKSKTIVEE